MSVNYVKLLNRDCDVLRAVLTEWFYAIQLKKALHVTRSAYGTFFCSSIQSDLAVEAGISGDSLPDVLFIMAFRCTDTEKPRK